MGAAPNRLAVPVMTGLHAGWLVAGTPAVTHTSGAAHVSAKRPNSMMAMSPAFLST